MTTSIPQQLRSDCPVSAVLNIFGDKWTFLIIRDVIIENRHKYNEFAAMKDRIPTNILADRLKRLVEHDILEKRLYQERPNRYEYHLTQKGKELKPIIYEMVKWGLNHVSGTGASKGY
ncbi:MAG: DNA-binding HxlR family transcriptional regulator [Cellvibrionaceae bacterium]|jgi:DNA-binding HxlR family transcriptional regulator